MDVLLEQGHQAAPTTGARDSSSGLSGESDEPINEELESKNDIDENTMKSAIAPVHNVIVGERWAS